MGPELFSQDEVSAERFEHVLPRTDCIGVPDRNLGIVRERPDAVRNEAVFGPVPPAENIACPSRGDGRSRAVRARLRKEGIAIGGGDQFGAGLAATIRITPSQGVVFAIRRELVVVVVSLVPGEI